MLARLGCHARTVSIVLLVAGATPVLSAQEFAPSSAEATAGDNPLGGPSESPTWKGALADSMRLLVIQHTARITFQAKTRRELGGPFVSDYIRSVHVPKQWSDGDGWLVNNIGHPIQGAAAGFIWIDNERTAPDPAEGFTKTYWDSRYRAAIWAAVYSFQFEFGPLSEASVGNVGLRPNTTGWTDHLMTPVGGLGVMFLEDMADRYLIRKIEAKTTNPYWRGLARVALNPSHALSNAAQGRAPWAPRIERYR
jgi:hypothetical protein